MFGCLLVWFTQVCVNAVSQSWSGCSSKFTACKAQKKNKSYNSHSVSLTNIKVHDSSFKKTEQQWFVWKDCQKKASSLYKVQAIKSWGILSFSQGWMESCENVLVFCMIVYTFSSTAKPPVVGSNESQGKGFFM